MQSQSNSYADLIHASGPAWRGRAMRGVLLLMLAVSMAGCSLFKTKSKQDALKDIEWAYDKAGIELRVRAQPDLNQSGGQPHTLLMSVIQMEDPSAFEPHISGPDSLAALLLAETAPGGLLTLQKYYIEPGSERTIRLARVEKARYVALVLGYQHLDPARSTRLYQIGADLDYSGLLLREYQAAPEPLHIDVLLGAESVQDSLTARQREPEAVQPAGGLMVPLKTPAAPKPAPSEPTVERILIPSPQPVPGT